MSAHTPGPWHAERKYAARSTMAIMRDWSDHHCAMAVHTSESLIPAGGVDEQTVIANARLMAAAPDLLEALKLAESFVHLWMEVNTGEPELAALEQIESAIAKAEGAC